MSTECIGSIFDLPTQVAGAARHVLAALPAAGRQAPAWISIGRADVGPDGPWRRAIPGTLVVGGGAATGIRGAVVSKQVGRKEGRHKKGGLAGRLKLSVCARLIYLCCATGMEVSDGCRSWGILDVGAATLGRGTARSMASDHHCCRRGQRVRSVDLDGVRCRGADRSRSGDRHRRVRRASGPGGGGKRCARLWPAHSPAPAWTTSWCWRTRPRPASASPPNGAR